MLVLLVEESVLTASSTASSSTLHFHLDRWKQNSIPGSCKQSLVGLKSAFRTQTLVLVAGSNFLPPLLLGNTAAKLHSGKT